MLSSQFPKSIIVSKLGFKPGMPTISELAFDLPGAESIGAGGAQRKNTDSTDLGENDAQTLSDAPQLLPLEGILLSDSGNNLEGLTTASFFGDRKFVPETQDPLAYLFIPDPSAFPVSFDINQHVFANVLPVFTTDLYPISYGIRTFIADYSIGQVKSYTETKPTSRNFSYTPTYTSHIPNYAPRLLNANNENYISRSQNAYNIDFQPNLNLPEISLLKLSDYTPATNTEFPVFEPIQIPPQPTIENLVQSSIPIVLQPTQTSFSVYSNQTNQVTYFPSLTPINFQEPDIHPLPGFFSKANQFHFPESISSDLYGPKPAADQNLYSLTQSSLPIQEQTPAHATFNEQQGDADQYKILSLKQKLPFIPQKQDTSYENGYYQPTQSKQIPIKTTTKRRDYRQKRLNCNNIRYNQKINKSKTNYPNYRNTVSPTNLYPTVEFNKLQKFEDIKVLIEQVQETIEEQPQENYGNELEAPKKQPIATHELPHDLEAELSYNDFAQTEELSEELGGLTEEITEIGHEDTLGQEAVQVTQSPIKERLEFKISSAYNTFKNKVSDSISKLGESGSVLYKSAKQKYDSLLTKSKKWVGIAGDFYQSTVTKFRSRNETTTIESTILGSSGNSNIVECKPEVIQETPQESLDPITDSLHFSEYTVGSNHSKSYFFDNVASRVQELRNTDGVERVSFSFYDFDTDTFFGMNDKEKVKPASMTKPMIMLAALNLVKNSKRGLDEKLEAVKHDYLIPDTYVDDDRPEYTLQELIEKSVKNYGSYEANLLLYHLGFDTINNELKKLGFDDTEFHGYYAPERKSPKANFNHNLTTLRDTTLMNVLLKKGIILDSFLREQARKYMEINEEETQKLGNDGTRIGIAEGDKNHTYSIWAESKGPLSEIRPYGNQLKNFATDLGITVVSEFYKLVEEGIKSPLENPSQNFKAD